MSEATRHTREPVTWPSRDGRPRVLVEAGSEDSRQRLAVALTDRGYEVLDCGGPVPDEDLLCPVVEGGRCPGAAHADVVVCDFDEADAHTRGLPSAVRKELRTGASVIVLADPDVAGRRGDELDGCRLLHHPVSTDALLDEVGAALDDLANTPAPRRLRSHGLEWARSGGV